MAYIGKTPVIGNFVKLDAVTAVNGQAAYTMQNGSANFTDYSTVNQFMVSLNGTIQAPTDSFTVSGSTLTFASNLSTGDVIDFIIVFGNSLSAGTPTDATVSTAKIVDDAVTAAKINNDIISGSTELASEPADTDEFLVSDAGTLKRIDYSLIKGGGCWEKLDTITISGTTSQIEHEEANFTSTHRDYKIMFSGLTSTADNALYMRIAGDGATLLSTSDYTYAVQGIKANTATNTQYSTSADKFYIGGTYTGTGGSYTSNFEINLYNPLSTSTYMTWSGTGMQTDDGDKTMTFTGAGQYVAADSTAMKRFVFYRGSGDFNGGVITLYGRVA